jgi:hypothetical protein
MDITTLLTACNGSPTSTISDMVGGRGMSL